MVWPQCVGLAVMDVLSVLFELARLAGMVGMAGLVGLNGLQWIDTYISGMSTSLRHHFQCDSNLAQIIYKTKCFVIESTKRNQCLGQHISNALV